MIVVNDTSPIINLAVIGYLHLLPQLFGTVVMPKQVFEEIVHKGNGEPVQKKLNMLIGYLFRNLKIKN